MELVKKHHHLFYGEKTNTRNKSAKQPVVLVVGISDSNCNTTCDFCVDNNRTIDTEPCNHHLQWRHTRNFWSTTRIGTVNHQWYSTISPHLWR